MQDNQRIALLLNGKKDSDKLIREYLDHIKYITDLSYSQIIKLCVTDKIRKDYPDLLLKGVLK